MASQVLVDDLHILFLCRWNDIVKLQISAVILGVYKQVILSVFFEASLTKLEEYSVHKLHAPLELRERVVEQVSVFALKQANSHNWWGNYVDDRAVVEVVRSEVHLELSAHSLVVLQDLFTLAEVIAQVQSEMTAAGKHSKKLIVCQTVNSKLALKEDQSIFSKLSYFNNEVRA